jgi:hypothetical protein
VPKEGRQSTLSQIRRVFPKDVLPMIGRMSIYELQRPDPLDVVAQIERRGALTAVEKVRTWFGECHLPGQGHHPGGQWRNVVICDVDPRAIRIVKVIEEQGGIGLFIQTDVSQAESVEALVAATVKRFGKLDAAFNNAGLSASGPATCGRKPLDKTRA